MNSGMPFDLNEPADGDTEGQTHEHVNPHHHKTRAKLSCGSRMQVVMWLLNNQT